MAVKLQATIREAKGKYNNLMLRDGGEIPGIVYGKGEETKMISFSRRDIEKVLVKSVAELDLEISGQVIQVKIAEVQYYPTGTYPIHIDFLYRK